MNFLQGSCKLILGRKKLIAIRALHEEFLSGDESNTLSRAPIAFYVLTKVARTKVILDNFLGTS